MGMGLQYTIINLIFTNIIIIDTLLKFGHKEGCLQI